MSENRKMQAIIEQQIKELEMLKKNKGFNQTQQEQLDDEIKTLRQRIQLYK